MKYCLQTLHEGDDEGCRDISENIEIIVFFSEKIENEK